MLRPIFKCLSWLTCLTVVLAAAGIGFLFFAYQVVDEGLLQLPNAPGNAVIVRESDSGIAHIRGDDYPSVAYAQGFAHA